MFSSLRRKNDNTQIVAELNALILSINPLAETLEEKRFSDNTDVVKAICLLGLALQGIGGGGGETITASNGLRKILSNIELGGDVNKDVILNFFSNFKFDVRSKKIEMTNGSGKGLILNELTNYYAIDLGSRGGVKFLNTGGSSIKDVYSEIRLDGNDVIVDVNQNDSSSGVQPSKKAFRYFSDKGYLGIDPSNTNDDEYIISAYNLRTYVQSQKTIVESKILQVLRAEMVGNAIGQVGSLCKSSDAGSSSNPSGKQITDPFNAGANSNVSMGYLITKNSIIKKIGVKMVASSTNFGTVGANPKLKIRFFTQNYANRTQRGSDIEVFLDPLKVGIFNNLNFDGYQYASADVNISLSEGDILGWEFVSANGTDNDINSVSRLHTFIQIQ